MAANKSLSMFVFATVVTMALTTNMCAGAIPADCMEECIPTCLQVEGATQSDCMPPCEQVCKQVQASYND